MTQQTVSASYAKHEREHRHLHTAFGGDPFGVASEKIARFFGTPKYIIGQSIVVLIWIVLNLVFSTQAAYAAPLILLAQTRQADRDKAQEEAAAKHRDELASNQARLLEENTELTKQVAKLSREIDERIRSIHARVVDSGS